MQDLDRILNAVRRLMYISLAIASLMVFTLLVQFDVIVIPGGEIAEEPILIQNDLPGEIGSIDEESGLVIDHGINAVKAQCGACHSTKLVAQNRFSRQGWLELIQWMQAEQNLWDLGEHEVVILDYLEKNCAPKKSGRRRNLEITDWYVLSE